MLKFFRQLYFPTLVRVGDINFKVWPDSSAKTTDLYKLDWSNKDKACKKKFEDTRNAYQVEMPEVLPGRYEAFVQDLRFVIPAQYMKEIRRTARKALMEWTEEKTFDNRIREICLAPAISAISVAFELIADCTYDQTEKYYYRGYDKIVIPHMLAYKFWLNQTAPTLIRQYSGWEKLEHYSKYKGDMSQAVQEFLDTFGVDN